MKSILFIDDDAVLRQLFLMTFSSSGYEVLQACDGREGLEVLVKVKPDLIICDIMMPEVNGFEFVEKLHEDPLTASIPVIFLTACRSEEYRTKAAALAVNDYFEKPLKPKELLALILPYLEDH